MLLIETIKNEIISKLQDYKDCKVAPNELHYLLLESENATGSIFCNTYQTLKYIAENINLFYCFQDYYLNNIGESINVLSQPEKNHVIFMLSVYEIIFSRCECLTTSEDDIILNERFIQTLTSEINFLTIFDNNLFI